jgi:histone-lysine N-methyltransferase SETMAR
MSKEMHIDILRRLRDAVRRKRPKKMRTNIWFLLHDNAPAHRSVLVKDFLAKNYVTKLEHPPYSPDLAPADFYLFSRLKSALKG